MAISPTTNREMNREGALRKAKGGKREIAGWILPLNLTVSDFLTAAGLKGLKHPAIILYSFWVETAVIKS